MEQVEKPEPQKAEPPKVEPQKKLVLSAARLTIYFSVIGAAVGVFSGIITKVNIRFNIMAPLIALFLFYISYKLTAEEKIKNKFLMAPVEVTEEETKINVAMSGFFPYFIMWLVFWVMIYTLLVM